MRFVCDIDNVIVEWQHGWARLYENHFDAEIDPALLTTWTACLDLTHFETMGEFFAWFDEVDGWGALDFVPGAYGGLRELHRAGIDYVLCTARTPAGHSSAIALAETLPGRPQVEFRNPVSKHLTKGGIWLDDSPEVLTSLVKNGKRAIRFARPWNEGLPRQVEKQLLVANDWDDVVELVLDERSRT